MESGQPLSVLGRDQGTFFGVSWLPTLAFHPRLPVLATLGEEDRVIRLWELNVKFLVGTSSSTKPTSRRTPKSKAAVPRIALSIEEKRDRGTFDVFLCYNKADRVAVKTIGSHLLELGILPWLDEWQLPPGRPWQKELEGQIRKIRSAAVFVGKKGIGPWQDLEQAALLRQFVKRKCPVIPVLLAPRKRKPKLPIFLEGMNWVDFGDAELDAYQQLIWGITGSRSSTK